MALETDISHSPKLLHLYAFWKDKCGRWSMPARQDIDVPDLAPWLGNLHLVDVEENPQRFRYRVFATNIALLMRKELTGHFVDDHSPAVASEVLSSYEKVVQSMSPLYRCVRIVGHDHFFDFSRLLLPLSNDRKRVTQLVVGSYPVELTA